MTANGRVEMRRVKKIGGRRLGTVSLNSIERRLKNLPLRKIPYLTHPLIRSTLRKSESQKEVNSGCRLYVLLIRTLAVKILKHN